MNILRYAVKELCRRKRRTIVNIIGYVIALILLISAINALINNHRTSSSILESTGTHFIAYLPLCSDEVCKNTVLDEENEGFYSGNTETKIINRDYVEAAKSFTSIKDASAFLLFKYFLNGDEILVGGINQNGGASLQNNSCAASDIISGRFLRSNDSGNILVEHSYAKSHSVEVNDTITLSNKTFTIVGIVDPGIRPAKADIYMPYSEAKYVINTRLKIPLLNEMNILLVESLDAINHKRAMEDIKYLLGGESIISTYGCYIPAANVLGISEKGLIGVSLLVYLFMLLLTLKTHSSIVIERRFEIGVLHAIGWRRRQIVGQFTLEALIQSAVGWVLGGIITGILLYYLSKSNEFHIHISSFLIGLGIVISGSIAGSFVPATAAVRKNPAFCLRNL